MNSGKTWFCPLPCIRSNLPIEFVEALYKFGGVGDAFVFRIAFGGAVGELGSHVLGQYRHPDHPEIVVLSNTVENGRRVGLADAGSYWHSDISYKARPSDATVLYALEVPETGGDTQFINMTAVYDDLPAELRARVDGLEAIHDYAYRSDRLAAETGVRDALTEAQRRAQRRSSGGADPP